jgi:F420H(2)-dependent quinone reductase
MPLMGEYEPSSNPRDRKQVEQYEATNGVEGGTLKGKPVIVLTYKGAKSGKIRKTPLMRIEHNGTYAVVASNGGAPTHPLWYRNVIADPLVELQDGQLGRRCGPAKSSAMRRTNGGSSRTPPIQIFPRTAPVQAETFRCSSWRRSERNDSIFLCSYDCGLEVP